MVNVPKGTCVKGLVPGMGILGGCSVPGEVDFDGHCQERVVILA